jgi:predicted dehydrogenase
VDLYGKTYCYQEQKSETFVISPGLSSTGLWNRMMNDFYHSIREGMEPAVTLRKHYNTIQAMVAGYESVTTGEVIKL